MGDQGRAGRSPAEAWEREAIVPALGTGLLGSRLVGSARVAAALHLLAEQAPDYTPNGAPQMAPQEAGAQ